MKIIFVFTIIGLVASRSFTLEELQNLHSKVSIQKPTTVEKIQIWIDNQNSNAPCKRYIFKGRSTANCGNSSANRVQNLTANQKARLARYLDLIQNGKIHF